MATEELTAVRQALVPYERRLGITGLCPDDMAAVLVEALRPVIRRGVSQELEAPARAREGALTLELEQARSELGAALAELAAMRTQALEHAATERTLELELEQARAEGVGYREALARAARGEQWAAREALR